MNVIDATGLHKAFGTTCILDAAGCTVGAGEKVGLVGRNGCGKSTLLRILAGAEEADAGHIVRRRGLACGYLAQRPQLDPAASVRQVLEEHLGLARQQLQRHRELSAAVATAEGPALERLLDEQQQVHAWLDHHGAWHLDHRVEEMCTRFGVADPEARIGELSGGWAQRVALAGMLLSRPDLLLLDEPTNQLDTDTIAWLEDQLREYPGAVLLVTHDRYFLDRVAQRMLELEGGTLTAYDGGYSRYLEQKAEQLALQERTQTRLLNLLRREEAWLARGAKARTTKQKARIERVDDLRQRKTGAPARELNLELHAARTPSGTLLESRGLCVEVAGRRLVQPLDFILRRGERVGILGRNGCGKTSLLRTLLGQLAPAAGSVTVGKHAKVGYLDQLRSGLDDSRSVAEALGDDDWVSVSGQRRHKVGYLEDFLFPRRDQDKPVSTLSGGERARLLLARLLLQSANLLVLDEPTNDLDIPTLQIMDEALADFAGSVLMVTHDRYFLDRVASAILYFEDDGRVLRYEGNYEVFTRLRATPPAAAAPAAGPKATAAKPEPPSASAARPRRRSGLTFRERQELEQVEQEIEQLEARHGELAALLADPATVAGDHRQLQQLGEEFSALEPRLAALLERWEELEDKR